MKHNKIVIKERNSSSLYDQFFENLIILHLKKVHKWTHFDKSEKQAIYILNLKGSVIKMLDRYGSNLNQSITLATKYTKVKKYNQNYLIYFKTNSDQLITPTFFNPYIDIVTPYYNEQFAFLDSRSRFCDIGLDSIADLDSRCYEILEILVSNELYRRSTRIW